MLALNFRATGFTHPLKRQDRMGAYCIGKVANLQIFALSTLKGNGRSKMKVTWAAAYALPLFEAAAH
jgi:hypothetical protein